ncbi:MAG: hypothetical protein JF615_08255, partial [Asticcacaulis sp.]|nr:hypothetical protein [Asticcacaulis sp.]
MKLTVDFAFEGFKTLKTAPWAVPAWGCIILLAYAIGAAGLLPFAVPTIQKMINNGPVTDPSVVVTLMAQLILPYFLFILALLLAYNIVACAIYRIVLNRPKPNFAWVRLGSDEFRNIVVHILFGFIFMGVYMAALLGGGLAGGLVGYLLSLLNKDLMGLGLFLGIASGVVVMMWVLIRLSLFAIISFDRKQIDLFGS